MEGLIHLSDLKVKKNIQSENFYFELEPYFKKKLFDDCLSVSTNIKDLADILNIKYFNLWDAKNRTVISLTILTKLSKFLINNRFKGYSLKNIEKHVIYIKGGFTSERVYVKFPINLKTKEGIRIISHLYHDGGIGEKNRQPHYTNQSLDEVQEFLSDSKKLFGNFNRKITKHINLHSKKEYYKVDLPTVIGDLFISIGYKSGDKTRQNASIFGFLKELEDKTLIKVYLSKAFNDDGFVGNRQIGIIQACLSNNKEEKVSNVLLLDKLFLNKMGIKVNGPILKRRYKNRYGICNIHILSVYSRKNIQRFFENIRLISHKNKKIELYLTNWGLRSHKRDIYK